MQYTRLAQLRSAQDFHNYCAKVGAKLPFDEHLSHDATAPLAQTLDTPIRRVGNRFSILPMEGWDGTKDGFPSDLTIRRWQRFGASGAKLMWGGEAVAVRHDGRANPNQLVANQQTLGALAHLRETLVNEHQAQFGRNDDLVIGRISVEGTKQYMKGEYKFVELNAGYWLMQEKYDDISEEITEHIKNHAIKD